MWLRKDEDILAGEEAFSGIDLPTLLLDLTRRMRGPPRLARDELPVGTTLCPS